jgi:hypothetical protein
LGKINGILTLAPGESQTAHANECFRIRGVAIKPALPRKRPLQ